MSSQQSQTYQSRVKPNPWKLSKILHREVFLDGSIATSGPQKDRLLERIRNSKSYLQTSALMMKIFSAIFALAIYILAFVGMSNVNPGSVENTIFSLSATIAMVFVFQFMFVFTYGLIGLIGFFSSSAFKYLRTLPISQKKVQATVYLTFFRLIDWQIISIFIGFPLLSGVVIWMTTKSWLKILLTVTISSIVSFVNVIFLFSLMLSISLYISRKLYRPTGTTKAQTILQIIVTLLYAIVSLGAGLAITYLLEIIERGFVIGPNGSLINLLLNFILYPFGLTYLHAILTTGVLIGWNYISVQSILIPIVGFLLTTGFTYLIYRRSMGILSSLTKDEVYSSKRISSKDFVIKLDVLSPFKAIYKKDITYIFRNFSATLYFIFPILMPLVLLIQIFGTPSTQIYFDFFQIPLFTFFYSGMTISFGIMAVTAPESETGGLLYILPVKMKDLFRAKRRILYLSMSLSAIAPVLIMLIYPLVGKFPVDAFLPGIIIAINFLIIYFYGSELSLILYSVFFGKIRNKYTLQMVNVKKKIGKIILGIIILYIVCYFPLVVGFFLGLYLGESILNGSMIMCGISFLIFCVIRMVAVKLFNSH
ncbi:MAG: hypothetical protein JW776_14050 [Candidatus Lokiarchaeota archaeon]|nr:hypothetical protein [Candidatus Lokiarchaeota archaeon]